MGECEAVLQSVLSNKLVRKALCKYSPFLYHSSTTITPNSDFAMDSEYKSAGTTLALSFCNGLGSENTGAGSFPEEIR